MLVKFINPKKTTMNSYSENAKKFSTKRCHSSNIFTSEELFDDKNSDFHCPICFDIIEEAFMTKCGHTFCHKCITRSLENSIRCPKCNGNLGGKNDIYPNFLLNELVSKYKNAQQKIAKKLKFGSGEMFADFKQILMKNAVSLDINEINWMLDILYQKKQELQEVSLLNQLKLIKEFLDLLYKIKLEALEGIKNNIMIIEKDLHDTQEKIKDYESKYLQSVTKDDCFNKEILNIVNSKDTVPNLITDVIEVSQENNLHEKVCDDKKIMLFRNVSNQKKSMYEHFEDLVEHYFTLRNKQILFDKESYPENSSSLKTFGESLSKLTQYNSVQVLATLNYSTDLLNSSNIVSSIEFDKDFEIFAIAGVTKRIKIFQFSSIIYDIVDIHYPFKEMVCNSKISCISWNNYFKNFLASSDYDGTVSIWDAYEGQRIKYFQEHEKRCWSVDFNFLDTKLLASGSDDCKVKLWTTNLNRSVTCLEAQANVCCVKFNPKKSYELAYGSADHCVHYYDFRYAKTPLTVLKGHQKAVSYVKFISDHEIVSASTDNQLKLWDISRCNNNTSVNIRSFGGHINEKNFVGLTTDGDYIACGSENNSMYVYYKGLSKHLFCYKFDAMRTLLEKDNKDDDTNEFVSAVCWKEDSNVIIAANSQGSIKILQLI